MPQPIQSPETTELRASPARFAAKVFIVGSPRSGTTWTQLLIAQHPRVCTSQENQIFSRYLGALVKTYDRDAASERTRGLARHLSRSEMATLCAGIADAVFARLGAEAPGADVLLQKIPDVGGDASLVLDMYPDARFVHVVRDPRAVVASFRAASSGWGRAWAPSGALRGARRWCEAVTSARRIPERTKAFFEVRYEDLHADTPAVLARIFEFAGLPADRELCERAVAACAIEDLRERKADLRAPWDVNQQRDGVFRKGETESWREELSRRDVRLVESVAWDLMAGSGYTPVHPHRPRAGLRARLQLAAARVSRRLAAGAERVAQWIDERGP